jgi:hypothetical protein
MTKRLLFVCGLSLLLLLWAAARAGAQTVAAGPYYATPSWDQKLTCSAPANCPRFVVLSNWNNEAVLDRETGLVWQKQPTDQKRIWNVAFQVCIGAQTGGRKGWRLPSIHELQSLIDPNVFDENGDVVSLPLGHPFVGITAGLGEWYWTNTSVASDPSFAYRVGMAEGMSLANSLKVAPGLPRRFWCVRGGGPIDAQ